MDGEQGALNHLLAGDPATALHDVETSLGKLFVKGETGGAAALKTFIAQFATPFGSQALALAGTAVSAAAAGDSIQTIAATVTPQITADAVTDAEKAGEVVLNAVRVQLVAAATPPAQQAPNPSAAASAQTAGGASQNS